MKKKSTVAALTLAIAGFSWSAFADQATVVTGSTTFGMGIGAVGEIAGLSFNDQTPGSGEIVTKCASTNVKAVSICSAKIETSGTKITKVYWARQVSVNPVK